MERRACGLGRRWAMVALVGLTAVAATACGKSGGGGNTTGPTPAVTVDGSYRGNLTAAVDGVNVALPMEVTLQGDRNVSGTYTIRNGGGVVDSGSVRATLSGTTIKGRLTSIDGSSCGYSAEVSPDGVAIDGELDVTNCGLERGDVGGFHLRRV